MNAEIIFDEHRSLLFAIAYRMVGTVMDAEDLVQETYLRWDAVEVDGVDNPGAFLRTVITRLAIDHLRKEKKAREQYDGLWLPEPWVDAESSTYKNAELADSLSTAFMVVLETLAPPERAAFLLKEVFGYSYREIAEAIGKSEANSRQIVKRAKEKVHADKPTRSVDLGEVERLVGEFVAASGSESMDGFVAILSEDAILYSDHGGKVLANKRAIFGPDKIGRFIHGIVRRFTPEDYRVELREINGAPGLVAFEGDEPSSATTFEIVDGKIRNIYIVRNPEKLVGLRSEGIPDQNARG